MSIITQNNCAICSKECKNSRGLKVHQYHCQKKLKKQQLLSTQQLVLPNPVNPGYLSAPGSKITTFQIEFDTFITKSDIQSVLNGNTEQINNPQQTLFLAYLIQQLQSGISEIGSRTLNTIQLNYSLYENKFIATISFRTDSKTFSQITKLIAQQCFMRNLTPVYKNYNQTQFSAEQLESSIRFLQNTLKVFIVSKITIDKFQNGNRTLSQKQVAKKLNQAASKLDYPKVNPIPNQMISMNSYSKSFIDLGVFDEIHRPLIIQFLNDQCIDFLVFKKELRIKSLNSKIVSKLSAFMKNKLKYCANERIKSYASLSLKEKQNTKQEDFDFKQNNLKSKKDLQLIQTLSYSSIPLEMIKDSLKQLNSYRFSTIPIIIIKDLFVSLAKNIKKEKK